MYKGVLIDWGGVLTTSMYDSIMAWVTADRIDPSHYREVMREMIASAYTTAHGDGSANGGSTGPIPADGSSKDAAVIGVAAMEAAVLAGMAAGATGDGNPIHALERGEIDPREFERDLAARLITVDGGIPEAEGMLNRMFAAFEPVESMYTMLRTARAAGLKTCLLSNSWGNDYPREHWTGAFDEVIISGEVGMRKPEPRIFHHSLDAIGLTARQCVFVDDLAPNVAAAQALGITGVHHTDATTTIGELETLLGMPLRSAAH
ncbi:HAD family hydrolase [Sinosporangium siamense]|uniref:Hydrolase of the HAD superfamily n=1 Tax=Sinosporangium siamense TaxID=1367973 RepID=A0A919RCC2_9ACTN|nr:HAD family phosphatase [Sinosporangium siamense]GII91072.1 hypothetical protein Ssi02_13030 [Sinosporangium siamense]